MLFSFRQYTTAHCRKNTDICHSVFSPIATIVVSRVQHIATVPTDRRSQLIDTNLGRSQVKAGSHLRQRLVSEDQGSKFKPVSSGIFQRDSRFRNILFVYYTDHSRLYNQFLVDFIFQTFLIKFNVNEQISRLNYYLSTNPSPSKQNKYFQVHWHRISQQVVMIMTSHTTITKHD